MKDLRLREDPVDIPPRKERAPVRHLSLPVRATEFNQLSHPRVLKRPVRPKSWRPSCFEPPTPRSDQLDHVTFGVQVTKEANPQVPEQ